MLRLLPYVIVSLLLFLGAKLLEAVDYTAANADIVVSDKNNLVENHLNQSDNNEFLKIKESILLSANDQSNNQLDNNFTAVQQTVEDAERKIIESKNRKIELNNNAQSEDDNAATQGQNNVEQVLQNTPLSYVTLRDECTKIAEFSPITLDILQELKQRREELESREQEFLLRMNALNVAKRDLEAKLELLTDLQADLESALRQYEEREYAKTLKLVKIYESMKPTDAAKIFDDMQTFVLLDVVEQMKEARLAPILASMEPEKAKELTIGLINRRKTLHN